MTTREIIATFKEMYDADILPTLISRVTNAVIEEAIEWQSRPLDPVSPIDLDCIVVIIRQDKRVIKESGSIRALHLCVLIVICHNHIFQYIY